MGNVRPGWQPDDMMSTDPRVDRHRGAVYQAEESVAAVMRSRYRTVRIRGQVVQLPAEITLGTLAAVQAFSDEVLAEPTTVARYPGRGAVTVEAKRGFRSATYSAGRIRVPAVDPRGRWAMAQAVVLHECAHHLVGEPGHGRAFRDALRHLYRVQLGEGAEALLEHLFAPIDALPEPTPADGAVRRVAALLAKAQSTTSPEESEAYLEKAALVAQRHSVDMAVAAMADRTAGEHPTHRMLTIGEPRRALNKQLVTLLVSVAHPWSVRVDIGAGSTYVIVFGMPSDLDQVESVFAAASALMIARAEQHVRQGGWRGTAYVASDGSGPRPVTATVARNAFCLGFTRRLGERLGNAASAARRDAAASSSPTARGSHAGQDQVALALRAREIAVTDYHRSASRARGRWRGSASAAGSASASRRAGERAAEEYGRRSIDEGRRAIGAG